MKSSPIAALVIQPFSPLSFQPSAVLTALVWIEEKSLPAPGSLKAVPPKISAFISAGTWTPRCRAVGESASRAATLCVLTKEKVNAMSARDISSQSASFTM